MPLSNTAPALVQGATNRAKALELRIQGLTLAAIGEQLGVSKSRAFQYVSEGLAELNETCVVHAEELRRLSTEQLDQLIAAHMPAALEHDVKAAGVVLRALDSRAKLYGLIKPQVSQPASRFEAMTPEELKEEARRLGIYHDDPFTASDHYRTGPSANGQSPMNWPRRNNDGSLAPR
jgi:hypothetical protein